MMCELATRNGMIERAGSWTWFDVTCNSDDYQRNSVEPQESGPRIRETRN